MKKLLFLLLLFSNCYANNWKCKPSFYEPSICRLSVPHGWLIAINGKGITFYPDEKYEWKL